MAKMAIFGQKWPKSSFLAKIALFGPSRTPLAIYIGISLGFGSQIDPKSTVNHFDSLCSTVLTRDLGSFYMLISIGFWPKWPDLAKSGDFCQKWPKW